MKYNIKCKFCGKDTVLDLDPNKVERWQAGELVQNVFPELDPNSRELLVSGICGNCFDALFAEEED